MDFILKYISLCVQLAVLIVVIIMAELENYFAFLYSILVSELFFFYLIRLLY